MTCKFNVYGMCVCRNDDNVSMRSETDTCYCVFMNNDEKNCTGYVDKKD